ncbi:hypothetical protein AYI68_g8374 [Smittium mucronatum]|uniref:Uncharacterized protein n=1 Tax=Smittium mucronatum TaxID=133383 RepID=A0A1R0GL25_9FUNG|nr:hypothetical protein AYI68_g8374 [Smittium mucronatum]
MKISFSGLFLASAAVISASASPVAEDSLNSEHANIIAKRDGGGRGGNRGGNHGHGNGRGNRGFRGGRYYGYGRYWDFDSYSDNIFITGLRYRPSNYYGQRFQYLYQGLPDFRNRWNSDIYFRNSWNSDLYFRNSWFSSVYPYGYGDYRVGGRYYGYRNRYGGRGGNRGGNRGGHRG